MHLISRSRIPIERKPVRPSFRWSLPVLACIGVAQAALFISCSRKTEPTETAAQSPLPPVPRPADLIGEVFVIAPDTFWSKLRGAMGGRTSFLPQSAGGLVATFFGIPIGVAGEFDGTLPAFGALSQAPDGTRRGVFGIHVKAGERVVEQLTQAPNARFGVAAQKGMGLTLLSPTSDPKPSFALGVVGNYFLIGRSTEDISTLGPYVARTMPTLKLPKEEASVEFEGSGIRDVAVAWLTQFAPQASALMGGGDSPAGALETARDSIGSLEKVRLTVEFLASSLRTTLHILPRAESPLAGTVKNMKTAPLAPLLSFVSEARGAILLNDLSNPEVVQGMLARFVPEKAKSEREIIAPFLLEMRAALDDSVSAAWLSRDAKPVVLVQADLRSPQAFSKAFSELQTALMRKPMTQALNRVGLRLSRPKSGSNVPSVEHLRLDILPTEDGARETPDPVDVFVSVTEGRLKAAIGPGATAALLEQLPAAAETSLGAVQEVARLQSGQDDVVAAALLDLALMGTSAKTNVRRAPVLLSVGRSGGNEREGPHAWLRLEASKGAVEDAAAFVSHL